MLDYVALFVLIFVGLVIFYGIIAIHDVPYDIAHRRNHPHQDAIHAAGWVSLFTLHALWPFLWIWAMAYRPERGWGFAGAGKDGEETTALRQALEELRHRVDELEAEKRSQRASDSPPAVAAPTADVVVPNTSSVSTETPENPSDTRKGGG